MLALITPPLLQPNTPYPATPVLLHELKKYGHDVIQRDFSLETLLRLLTPETIRAAGQTALKLRIKTSESNFFADAAEDYARLLPSVIQFLQGKLPALAGRIAARRYLPEGPAFRSLYAIEKDDDGELMLNYSFGTMGTQDKARLMASLFMDDVAEFIKLTLDGEFAFGKYSPYITMYSSDMSNLLKRLGYLHPSRVDSIVEQLTRELIEENHPDAIGIAVPFPGTLYCAFRIAQTVRKISPDTTLILGGGYVNSELRDVTEPKLFDFFDFICYDDGVQPLRAILEHTAVPAADASHCPLRLLSRKGRMDIPDAPPPSMLVPDYEGLDLSRYFNLVEMANPVHRLWTDGKWIKMQLAHGCYWHKCAFCDLALDYIANYRPASPAEIVDAMESLIQSTGQTGFHFVDEALAPALVRGIANEIIRRNLPVTWWGNIRFDDSFTPELAELMADSGCIAVTGGLECAHDRLLKLMNKGITLASARNAMKAFNDCGIGVHAYLMLGFPTETEKEALEALNFVRKCFADGILQSAYWHRFALTVHSAVAQTPEAFGIKIRQDKQRKPRFALNELHYDEPGSPDWSTIHKAFETAVYNYMLGLGLELPVRDWLPRRRSKDSAI